MKKLLVFTLLIFCTQSAFAFDFADGVFNALQYIPKAPDTSYKNSPFWHEPTPLPPPDKDYMLKNLPVKPAKYDLHSACAYNDKLMDKLEENYDKTHTISTKIGRNSDGSTYKITDMDDSEAWRIQAEYYKRCIDTNKFYTTKYP